MADPADVAKDGYDALMAGDDKVVSGLKNKLQTAMSNLMPESTVAWPKNSRNPLIKTSR